MTDEEKANKYVKTKTDDYYYRKPCREISKDAYLDGLAEGRKELVEHFITVIQSGTSKKREIAKVVDNTYFVY